MTKVNKKANATAAAPASAPAEKPAEKKAEKPVIQPAPVDKTYEYRGRKFVDLRGQSDTMATNKAGEKEPHKYVKVHAAAEAAGSPCKLGWRYATVVFTANKTARERKAGSVHGIIQGIVKAAGPDGISGMELVPLVRAQGKTNTRTNFGAGMVPPIGWAEGWIDSAVTESILKIEKGKTLELADTPAEKAEEVPDEGKKAA